MALEYTKDTTDVVINDDLNTYINETFTPVTKDYLTRVIRTLDMFGYGDYSTDLYNFINLSKTNIDPDEEKLLFISLLISHVIKLIENIGLVVNDDIVNEDYYQYLSFFTMVLEALWLIKNMTGIDAIYFSDLINNDNLTDDEAILKILQYYSPDIHYDIYFYLITDHKESFLDIIKQKVNDLVSTDIIDDNDIDVNVLKDISVIINTLSNHSKNSLYLQLLTTTLEDFKYLIHSRDFINSNIKRLTDEFIKTMDSNNPNNYYLFIEENKEVFTMLLDMYLFNLSDAFGNMDYNLNDSIDYSYDTIKDIFYDREFKGISGLMKVLDNIKNILLNLPDDFITSFTNLIKGVDNG